MFTSKALNKQIIQFLSTLENKGFAVDKAILFGSYAKGKPHKLSDIDLAIWLKNDLQNHYTEMPSLLKIVSSYHPIKPKFYNKNETSDTDPFIEVIEKTGREILLPVNSLFNCW